MSRLSDQWIAGIKSELEKRDFDEMYKTITETRAYDRVGLRRLCILGIFLADDKRKSQYIPILGHYEAKLGDDDYSPIIEEIQRVIVTLQQVVKPETQTNRLYI